MITETTRFEEICHAADRAFRVTSRNMAVLLENADLAMQALDRDEARTTGERSETRKIDIVGFDRESLLVNWLNELNYISQTEFVLFNDFRIQEISDTVIKAEALGEKINPAKHHIKLEIKAATYHNLLVEKTEEGWRIQVIFDI